MNKIFPLVLCGVIPAYGAYALTCQNDYGGSTSCASNAAAAGDCETLGYSVENIAGCGHYLYCPFDNAYKKCVTGGKEEKSCAELGFTQDDKSGWCGKFISCESDNTYTACVEAFENPCPDGYDSRKTSAADCGSQGSNGWTFSSQTITGISGEKITCGKCTPKTCSGYYESYASVSDCGLASVSNKSGWSFSTCYSGETLKGKCTAKTCSSYGYRDSTGDNLLCKTSASVYLGDYSRTCQDCVNCNKSTVSYAGNYFFIGDSSCITICMGYTSSYKIRYGAFFSNFVDKQGRSGRCYAWQEYGNSISPERYCCCQSGGVASSC